MKHGKHQSIRQPEYAGGPKALDAFVKENVRYPESRIPDQIKGVVRVKADINKKGEVVRAKVIAGLGKEFDDEAIRVVKLLKFLVPENRDIKITFHKQFNITFNPPKPQPKPKAKQVNIQISYHYTPKSRD